VTETPEREFDILEKAGLVLLTLQLAVFAKMWNDLGFDRATDGFPIFVMVTSMFVAGQRKLMARPPNRGAARWIFASRAAALAMLTLGTLAIGVNRLIPDAAPAPTLVLGSTFALMWAIIALKGAGVGKLKPGAAMGLRIPWTLQSRLAWDRAHRTLGRVLFCGGIIGLAMCLVVPPLISAAMWVGTVGLAVGAALLESWRTWRLDPDPGRPA
jgi:uncharacterized membrane protein